jgi:hypothetical protein
MAGSIFSYAQTELVLGKIIEDKPHKRQEQSAPIPSERQTLRNPKLLAAHYSLLTLFAPQKITENHFAIGIFLSHCFSAQANSAQPKTHGKIDKYCPIVKRWAKRNDV